jgi:hypothetical protein
MKTDSGSAIKDGCYTQENVNGVDVEACFCDPFIKDECNSANSVFLKHFVLFAVVLLKYLFGRNRY